MKKLVNLIRSKGKIIMAAVLCAAAVYAIIRYPAASTQGVRNGLDLCAQIMIPSMFPFLILSTFLIRSGIINAAGMKLDKVFQKIFSLSGKSGGVLIVSLFGGFPIGAKMTSMLLEKGEISRGEAQRMMMCTVNAGPAFVICTVGSALLKSTKAGVILFVSLAAASLMLAFLSRFTAQRSTLICKTEQKQEKLSEALVYSVTDGTQAMVSICAWIVVFSCICALLPLDRLSEAGSMAVKGILEVTLGCQSSIKLGNIPLIAAIIGWSGLCVHCQVFPFVMKTGIKPALFFTARLVHGILAALISSAVLRWFPCEIQVFSNHVTPAFAGYAVSASVSAGLLMMCAILILDLDTDKKVC